MTNPPMKAPPTRKLFGLWWEYSPGLPRFHRWGVSDGSRGVGYHANPLSAYLALCRWRRKPAKPGDTY